MKTAWMRKEAMHKLTLTEQLQEVMYADNGSDLSACEPVIEDTDLNELFEETDNPMYDEEFYSSDVFYVLTHDYMFDDCDEFHCITDADIRLARRQVWEMEQAMELESVPGFIREWPMLLTRWLNSAYWEDGWSGDIDEGQLAFDERRAQRQRRFTVRQNGTITRESGRYGRYEKPRFRHDYRDERSRRDILEDLRLEEQVKNRKTRSRGAKQSSEQADVQPAMSAALAANVASSRKTSLSPANPRPASEPAHMIDWRYREGLVITHVTKPTPKSSKVVLAAVGCGGGGIRVERYTR